MGMEVVPTLSLSRKVAKLGKTAPSPTPKAMAKNIQTVRNLVRKDRRLELAFPASGPKEYRRAERDSHI
jgi:hypothetical protein